MSSPSSVSSSASSSSSDSSTAVYMPPPSLPPPPQKVQKVATKSFLKDRRSVSNSDVDNLVSPTRRPTTTNKSYIRDDRLRNDGARATGANHPDNASLIAQSTGAGPQPQLNIHRRNSTTTASVLSNATAGSVDFSDLSGEENSAPANSATVPAAATANRSNAIAPERATILDREEERARAISLAVTNRLSLKAVTGKSTTSSADTLKLWLRLPLEYKNHILRQAKKVDDDYEMEGELWKNIEDLFPSDTSISQINTMKKAKVINELVSIWGGLRMIVYHPDCKFRSKMSNKLAPYLALMEASWDYFESQSIMEEISHKDGKSLPMPKDEDLREYCKDGAFKPTEATHRTCPRCLQPYMHEPPSNVPIKAKNDEKTRVYMAQCKHLKDFQDGKRGDRPLDKNDKPMNKIPSLRTEPELLVCKAYMMQHSILPDGRFTCKDCFDHSCPKCISKQCCFVCTKEGNHQAKRDHFQLHRGEEQQAKLTGREQSIALLNDAFRGGSRATADCHKTLETAQKMGMIDASTTEEDLARHAGRVGAVAQALAITNNPPGHESLMDFQNAYHQSLDQRGSTFTEKYGNLKASSSKKRAANTRLSNPTSLHHHRVSFGNKDDSSNKSMSEAGVANDDTDFEDNRKISSPIAHRKLSTPPCFTLTEEEDRPPTRPDIVEVRKAALMEIMTVDDNERRKVLHTIQDDFEYPYNKKDLIRANDLLNETGMEPKDRLDMLVNVVRARPTHNAQL